MRISIIQALGEQDLVKCPTILEALLKIQEGNQSESLRVTALKQLAKIDFGQFPNVLEVFLRTLSLEGESFVQIQVLESLGEYQNMLSHFKEAIDILVKLLKKGQFIRKKFNPFKSFIKQKKVEDFHWGVRKEAAKTLGKQNLISHPEAIKALTEALFDSHL